MRWERALLRAGDYLIGRSCRRLPGKVRDERYREWTAELPAILNDPGTRFAGRRAMRMLWYAADTMRGAARASRRGRPRPATRRAWRIVWLVLPELAPAAFIAWATVTASGNRVRYLLTLLLFYGAYRLARLGVRRLWARHTGRT